VALREFTACWNEGVLRGPRPAESVPQSNKRARECKDVSFAARTHISTVAHVQWRAFTS